MQVNDLPRAWHGSNRKPWLSSNREAARSPASERMFPAARVKGWENTGSKKGSRKLFFFFLIFKACSSHLKSKLVIIHLFRRDHIHPHYFKNLENTANTWKIFKNMGQGTTANTFRFCLDF